MIDPAVSMRRELMPTSHKVLCGCGRFEDGLPYRIDRNADLFLFEHSGESPHSCSCSILILRLHGQVAETTTEWHSRELKPRRQQWIWLCVSRSVVVTSVMKFSLLVSPFITLQRLNTTTEIILYYIFQKDTPIFPTLLIV